MANRGRPKALLKLKNKTLMLDDETIRLLKLFSTIKTKSYNSCLKLFLQNELKDIKLG